MNQIVDRSGETPAIGQEITLRPVIDEDHDLLFAIFASTRVEELSVTGWSDHEKETFLRAQFAAQTRYWDEVYPHAQRTIVLWRDKPVGRLFVNRRPAEIRVVDVTILPEYRGRGIGTCLLTAVLAEGSATGRPVTIHVERHNPALKLYQQLGFRLVEDRGVYLFLSLEPTASGTG